VIPAPRNALVSFHYYKSYDLDRLAGLRLIGDSGAFSAASQGATITTADLAGWAKRWAHRLAWVASLDVIGDPVATRRNWHDIVDNHGLPAVPTIHFGADPKLMDYYATRGVDFMGLGGMVGHKGQKAKLMRWLIAVFQYQARHWPDMRFHGWGVSSPELLRVPFYSVDSSGWGAAYRYGRLRIRDPRTGEAVEFPLDGRAAYRPDIAKLLSRHYGVAPSQVCRSVPSNRPLIVRVSALSASVNEQLMRRRLGVVSAPKWGGLAGAGPHLHLVEGYAPHLEILADLDGPHLHLADTDPGSLIAVARVGETEDSR
jgi:hypothetical protein